MAEMAAQKGDVGSVGGEGGGGVLVGGAAEGEPSTASGGEVFEDQPFGVVQGSAIGEDEPLAVGRPDGLQLAKLVVGLIVGQSVGGERLDHAHGTAGDGHGGDVAGAEAAAQEGDLGTVGGPGGVERVLGAGGQDAVALAVGDEAAQEDLELGRSGGAGDVGKLFAVGRGGGFELEIAAHGERDLLEAGVDEGGLGGVPAG